MTNRRYNNQGCEECGNPHTACREDDDGLMVCHDCQHREAIESTKVIVTKECGQHRAYLYRKMSRYSYAVLAFDSTPLMASEQQAQDLADAMIEGAKTQ